MRGTSIVAGLLLLCTSTIASAEPQQSPPDESSYVNQPFPDIVIRTRDSERRLSSLWREGPLLLTFVFTRCAGVCSPYLRALHAADTQLGAPTDVRRVVISFDPRDTADDMQRTAAHLGIPDGPGWSFGVATSEDIGRVMRAAGFWFAWDAEREQFDHPAMLVAIRDGRIVRLLAGGTVMAARLGEVLQEARGEFVASYPLPGNVRFRCFEYDPATGQTRVAWGALLMLVPAGAAVAGTLLIFGAPRRQSN
jgi:protein SCO1/2